MSTPRGRLLALLVAAVVALGSMTGASAVVTDSVRDEGATAIAKRNVPTRDQWLADVKAAMSGAKDYVRARVAAAEPGERLAVNFDIDNTVIATYYDGGGPIPYMLGFAKLLKRKNVALVFNTGRSADQRSRTKRQLTRAGFPVAALCLRGKGRTLVFGKQRCRDKFVAQGYTLIANVGNNATDLAGDGYEKGYLLPNYGGELG